MRWGALIALQRPAFRSVRPRFAVPQTGTRPFQTTAAQPLLPIMPKATEPPTIPLQGLFPVAKPSGPSSMKVIDSITPLLLESRLFDDPEKIKHAKNPYKKKKNLTQFGLKIGQGGTLDPLADGVLVIGVNRGTKHLNQFLECSKEYESVGLLGATTTTMDSEGEVLATGNFDNVTREDVEGALDRFRGEITQTPPIFSALKMEGKPLYEYARENKPLPRAIPTRKCQVSIELVDFWPGAAPNAPEASSSTSAESHAWRWPEKRLSGEEKEVFRRLTSIVHQAQSTEADAKDPLTPDLNAPEEPEVSPRTGKRPAAFKVKMTVSSGTYVRSIVNDIGLALGCGAHVQVLTRTRQGEFVLDQTEEDGLAAPSSPKPSVVSETQAKGGESHRLVDAPTTINSAIPWPVWERAIAERDAARKAEAEEEDEAKANGASQEEIIERFSKSAIARKRRTGDLKEWEIEMLRRFVSVPLPIVGHHTHSSAPRASLNEEDAANS